MPSPTDRAESPGTASAALPPESTVLEARDLVKTFALGRAGLRRSTVSAVDGVSLDVRAGEVVGVVGESGCGKSTLARMLVGLDRPDSGSLLFRGRDVARAGRAERTELRRGVQMVFQDPYTSLDPRMNILQIVGEPLAAARSMRAPQRRERVAELLELVGLPAEAMHRYPHEFSGGQRQRVGIARSLALNPAVLICDEPVSALDVSVQAQVINLLRDLQQRLGVAVVFIAHDLSVIRHLADRVAVMYLGRVVEMGETATVYERPAHPYTSALLSAAPTSRRSQRGRMENRRILPGDPPSPVDPPSGCRFRTRCWMAQDRCATEVPLLHAPDTDHANRRLSACHFAEDVD